MADQPTSGTPADLPEYYREIGHNEIIQSVKNFDTWESFRQAEAKVRNHGTKNFMIDFGDDAAWCGFDLGATSYKKLLRAPRPQAFYSRWINIWRPSTQTDVLKILAKHYDFSPRLLGLMCSQPPRPPSKASTSTLKESSMFRRRFGNRGHNSGDRRRKGHHEHDEKPEKQYDLEESVDTRDSSPTLDSEMMRELNHYHIVDNVWHWSSIDWGRMYVCLGYNSIYNAGANNSLIADGSESNPDLPSGKRVWTWLLLCENKTVISITEDPYPYHDSLDTCEQETLASIRRNLLNVFRQLSMAHDSSRDHPVFQLPIRKRVGNSNEETAHRPTDASGLLLYCLFDDWFTSYSLLARKEHRFAAELNKLQTEMLTTAALDHVNRLHHLGRQLAVLKRLYQSYELLIDRVLEKQESTIASLKNSNVVTGNMEESLASSQGQVHEMESLLGVALSSAARARFERLKYRIRLYALSEVQECLDQKESLVMMNFNLIAIKESYSVERLTRVTLFLAKITILFMPISLSTAYFSTQIKDVDFTLTQYWVTFTVVLVISILVLVGFGLVSGTMEGKMIYKPLSRKFLDGWKRVRVHRQKGRA